MLTYRDMILFYGALAVAGCLIVAGVSMYPDNREVAAGAQADVQSARYIDRDR